MLSKEAEDALVSVATRGHAHRFAEPRPVRAALLNHGLLYTPGGHGTRVTDTATPAGQMLAEYVVRVRELEHMLESQTFVLKTDMQTSVEIHAPDSPLPSPSQVVGTTGGESE